MIKHLAELWLLIAAFVFSSGASSQTTWNIVPGWNLLGNNSIGPLDITTYAGLADPAKVNSIWTWNNAASRWAFYTPSFDTATLATYAQSKGYDVLSSVASKQGFWVNAKTAVTVTSPWNSGTRLAESDLKQGWNLVGSNDNKTPSDLEQQLRQSLHLTGKSINTVWAWDNTKSTWRFHSPLLEAQGADAVQNYANAHGYEIFTSGLSSSVGSWINLSQFRRIQSVSERPRAATVAAASLQ